MKKHRVLLILALVSALTVSGCGSSPADAANPGENDTPNIIISVDDEPDATTPEPTPTEEPEPTPETREGYIRSDLTNEWIDEALADSRPLAVMVPDNKTALPQYNISNAGVIYECLAEGKISRLLCIWDDWRDMDRIGNVRSARAYYVYWALEWDPIFCHYGNVLYADPILNADACDNINGTKSPYGYYRVKNEGRITEQTAYTSTEDVLKACEYYDYSLTHTQYYTPEHWQFASETNPVDLGASYSNAENCTYVNCQNAYPDDKPYFEYSEEDGVYYRFQFGDKHMDAAMDTQLSFTNILIQYCDYSVIDQYDHLEYAFNSGGRGYYMTGGKAIPVTWKKAGDLAPTKFYDESGNEIFLNTGKTMVCVVGSNSSVSFE